MAVDRKRQWVGTPHLQDQVPHARGWRGSFGVGGSARRRRRGCRAAAREKGEGHPLVGRKGRAAGLRWAGAGGGAKRPGRESRLGHRHPHPPRARRGRDHLDAHAELCGDGRRIDRPAADAGRVDGQDAVGRAEKPAEREEEGEG
eukprot:scaffold13162_cov82-Isochrysis_galbana.AAC.3